MTAHLRNPASHNQKLTLIIMIAVSVLAHVLLFGSSMISWVRPLQLAESHTISVNLASTPSKTAPDTRRLGTDNNQGSGNTTEKLRQASHRNLNEQPTPAAQAAEPAQAAPQQRQVHTIRQSGNKQAATLPPPSAGDNSNPPATVNAAALLAQVGGLNSVQRGDVALNDSAQESGSKSGSGDSTHRYEWARYQTDWRLRIERIGNLNYPEEARRQNVHGSVTLEVTVAADGNLVKCRILRGSGHSVLDEGARRIVQMSAPFSPFPPALAAQGAKIIVQTFAFTRDNQLSSH
ncbi:energy transducer TonB [Aquitalea sp. LB_tupeE]|uniref:energy transducer TonB n=1 Tax=Aquitalea sp. LB_tupeE TaxID=2748078 RepID=UPI0015BD96BA|nr:energy transducer TonB [Aquitalea sp. LB_tupeE]NWK77454.1 energy transducer TonB [Aquitalea sp. LB_tupeE]